MCSFMSSVQGKTIMGNVNIKEKKPWEEAVKNDTKRSNLTSC